MICPKCRESTPDGLPNCINCGYRFPNVNVVNPSVNIQQSTSSYGYPQQETATQYRQPQRLSNNNQTANSVDEYKKKQKTLMAVLIPVCVIVFFVFVTCVGFGLHALLNDNNNAYTPIQTTENSVNENSNTSNDYSLMPRQIETEFTQTRGNLLYPEDAEIYNGLCEALASYSAYTYTADDVLTDEEIDRKIDYISNILAYYVLIDHPEFFWTQGNAYISSVTKKGHTELKFDLNVGYTVDEIKGYQAEVNKKVDEIIGKIPEGTTYEMALWVYEYLIDNCDYVDSLFSPFMGSTIDTSLYGLFINGETNCNGYCKAYKMIMDRISIPCSIAIGKCEDGVLHGWNIIELEDELYHVDVTWDDPFDKNKIQFGRIPEKPEIYHSFFCVTDEEIYKSRTLLEGYGAPGCYDNDFNYFVKNGLYYDKFSEQQFDYALDYCKKNNKNVMEIKYSNDGAMEDAYNFITADDGLVFEVFRQNGYDLDNGFLYGKNDDMNTIYIILY